MRDLATSFLCEDCSTTHIARIFFPNRRIVKRLCIGFLTVFALAHISYASNVIDFEGGRILLDDFDQVMCDNVTNGGEIAEDEFGCPNPVWDPSLITSVSLPTGGTGTLEYT